MSDSLVGETTDVENAKAAMENVDDEKQKPETVSKNIIEIDNNKDISTQNANDELSVVECSDPVEIIAYKESEVTKSETEMTSSVIKLDTDTTKENETPGSTHSVVASTKPQSFEKTQSQSLEVPDDAENDTVFKDQSSLRTLPEISPTIKTTDVTSTEVQSSEMLNSSSLPQNMKRETEMTLSVTKQDTETDIDNDNDNENVTPAITQSAVASTKPPTFEETHSQSLEVPDDADKDNVFKVPSSLPTLPEISPTIKTTDVTSTEVQSSEMLNSSSLPQNMKRETQMTLSVTKQDTETDIDNDNDNDNENVTPAITQSAVASTKPQSFEETHSQSLVVPDDADKDNVFKHPSSLQTSPKISRPIKTTDVTSSEGKSSEMLNASGMPSKDVDYADHVTYKEDGSAIYTDPQTKYQYKWCTETNNWTPCESAAASSFTSSDPYENEHYKWCQKAQKWIPKQSQVTETEHYKWDADKKQWLPKLQIEDSHAKSSEIVYETDENGQRTYTDEDGTVFFWDVIKSAWFPKIDDDFMARYQMSYGFIDNTSEANKEKEEQEHNEVRRKQEELEKLTAESITNDEASKGSTAAGVKRKAEQEPPKWFELDPSRNTKVYVCNLPLDITLDEFAELMGKCGMIMRDPLNQKFKLKLYTESDGQIKGDGLCDYIKVESVDLALKILDEYELRGNKIRVQRAQFQMRGEYNPALKPKRKKKDKEKLAKIKEKLFDWRPEKMRGERSKHEKTVIIKNLFHPELFEKEVQLILDYQNDLREECSKCGTVKKVVIYDRHSEGVAQISMTSPEEADQVIQMMQGRFFGKRQLTAEHWDGNTKYKIEETEEEIQKRLNKWDQYLGKTEASEANKRPSD